MKYRILLVISLIINLLYSQNIEFTAKVSKENLGVNERLRVEFTMNKNGDNFTPPDFQGFTLIMGPSQSVSESWINGVRSFSKTYGYILQPTAKGKFTIAQASIEIDGKVYKTSPIQITVNEAVNNPSIDKNSNDIAKDNLFLVAEVSKPNPYLNEAVSVVYRLYVGGQVALNDLRSVDMPKYPNFWSQEIRMQNNYEVENCSHNNRPFRCIVVKRVVLYPQKTGSITLEPLTLDAILSVPSSQRDFFGRPIMEQVAQRVTAGSRTINVKPLPEEGKPSDFSGAVGDFSFSVTTSKQELKANESFQTKMEISGNGNFKLFELPKLNFPATLEVYTPEQKDFINTSLSGMKGRVEAHYTIVPQYKGKYPVSGVSFSYFNPNTQKYVTIKSDELWIDVTEGAIATNENTAEPTKQSVQTQESQFRFLQLNAELQPIDNQSFFGSLSYYLWLFLPLLIIPIAIVIWKIQQKRIRDVEGSKTRAANRLAKKYLGEAKRKINDENTFYEALERALHNYLKAKLKIETSEMSKENISELLTGKQAKTSEIEDFIKLLKNCEMARYSQHSGTASLEMNYQEAVRIISNLDKQIKK